MLNSSSGSVVARPGRTRASDLYLVIGKNGEQVSLLDLSVMRAVQLENIRGKKMSLIEKLAFTSVRHKLRNSISKDGFMEWGRLEKYMHHTGGSKKLEAGGFALGFFLNLFGVLIAYLYQDEKRKRRIWSSWLGFGLALTIVMTLVAAGVNLK